MYGRGPGLFYERNFSLGVNFVSLLRDVASGAGRWKLRENHLLTYLPSNSESYGMHGMQLLGLQKKPLVGGPKFKSSRYAMPVGTASPGFELGTSTMTSCHGNRRSYTTICDNVINRCVVRVPLPYVYPLMDTVR